MSLDTSNDSRRAQDKVRAASETGEDAYQRFTENLMVARIFDRHPEMLAEFVSEAMADSKPIAIIGELIGLIAKGGDMNEHRAVSKGREFADMLDKYIDRCAEGWWDFDHNAVKGNAPSWVHELASA